METVTEDTARIRAQRHILGMVVLALMLLLITACRAQSAQGVEADIERAGDASPSESNGSGKDTVLQPQSAGVAEQIAATDKMAQEEPVVRLAGGTLRGMALSPDGHYLAGANESGLYLYRTDTLEQQWFGASDTPLNCLAWSPDGRYLLTGGDNGMSYVWQASDGSRLQTLTSQARGNTCPVAWSPDGQRVADGRVMWNASTWQVEHEFWGVAMSGRWGINAIAWSPDGLRIAFANNAGDIDIVNAAGTATVMRLCSSCGSMSRSLSWSPDGQRLAAGRDLTMQMTIWDTQSGTLIKEISTGCSRVAWSPDGTMLAAIAERPNTVFLLNTANWEQVRTWDLPFKGIQLSWSPDGRSLVTAGSDGSISVWPLEESTPPVAASPVLCKTSGPEVYLVIGNERRHIVDWDTFVNLGYRQEQIIPCDVMASYPEGAPITRLLKGTGDFVYWMKEGIRHHIPDMETFSSLGFQVKDIATLPDEVLNLWPLGDPLPSAQHQ